MQQSARRVERRAEKRGDALPKKQQQAYDFILQCVHAGNFPTTQQIAAHMRWKHASSASECLQKLVARGRIRRVTPSQRSPWELVPAQG